MAHRRIITRLGNSLAVTLPRDALAQAELAPGDYVWVTATAQHRLMLTKTMPQPAALPDKGPPG